jgi:histidinol-phosphate aminotransferase
VLQALLLAYGGPSRAAAVFEPTYALHSHIARLTRTRVAVGERAGDFTLDIDEVKRVMVDAAPDITFLCSPNNPTGRAEPEDTVRRVLDMAPGLVVVDEAYGQFSPWSAFSLLAREPGLVVVRTFSKTWSMAAARLGYLVAAPEVVTQLERVILPYHLDAVKQAAGRLALAFRDEMEQRVSLIVEERGRMAAALGELPVDTWPSEANFILFRPRHRSGSDVWQALVERSVLVRDCSSWDRLEGCLRVTVGSADENDAFLAALREALT